MERGSQRFEKKVKILKKIWIELLIKAVDEDLAKSKALCANKYCSKLRPEKPRAHGWRKRNMGGYKGFLCKSCTSAYDKGQFCQFCFKLYLNHTTEFSALDEKEWTQCEKCECWGHVDCLTKEHEGRYKKMKSEIASKNFKYICCDYNELSGKRKININKRVKYILT